MIFWNRIILENSIKDWAISLGFIIVAFSAIKIFRGPVVKKLRHWSEKTTNTLDDFLVFGIQKFLIPYLYFAAIFAAVTYLSFSPKITSVIRDISLVVTTFYILEFLSSAIKYAIFTFLGKQENSETKKKQARGLIIILRVLIWTLGLVFLVDNMGYNVTTIITSLGIGGIAIALAAQTVLGDLFSYFVIFFDRPFEIGDFIIVGDQIGAIEYIGVKTTRIRAITGEQIICANKDLTDSRVHNYKRMVKRRVVFNIGVTYDTPPAKIRKIPEIIKGIISTKEGVDLDRSHFSGFGDFSLNFETAYFVNGSDYTAYMDIQQEIYLEIMEAFDKEKVEFAFPTRTLIAGNSFTNPS
ncbi:MAG: mechanosensitive ion channel family protein [Bacteroidota bacterium]|nr:mechanosensitive ion channel family protein [Bacteroidota bacterium]